MTPLTSADGGAVRSAVPASGHRRRHPAPAHLRFFHGPMDCGKSTLALQVDHNRSRQGRRGLLLTQGDRSAQPRISSRVGLCREALEVAPGTDLRLLVRDHWAAGHRVDHLIVDEAQFLAPGQVDQLAELVDESHVDVYAFGLTTDFRARLFSGTQRLLEVADDVQRIQVEVLCWCGLPGLLNARWWTGRWCAKGETVVVADTAPTPAPDDRDADVHYRCSAGDTTCRVGSGPTRPVPDSSRCPDLWSRGRRRRARRPTEVAEAEQEAPRVVPSGAVASVVPLRFPGLPSSGGRRVPHYHPMR